MSPSGLKLRSSVGLAAMRGLGVASVVLFTLKGLIWLALFAAAGGWFART